MTNLIAGNMATKSFTGREVLNLSDSISSALTSYLTSVPNLLIFSLTGVAGPVGTVTGTPFVGLSSQAMSSLMYLRGLNLGLSGRDTLQLFQAISTGVTSNLQAMQVTGTAVGIATGTGIGRFVGINKQAVSSLLLSNMSVKRLLGSSASHVVESIATGFSGHLLQTPTVTAAVVGAPPPGAVPVAAIPTTFNKIV